MAQVRLQKPILLTTDGDVINGTNITIDATGEYRGVVGYVHLSTGTGTKTLSAAGGGFIIFGGLSGSVNDGGSDFRVGLQNVDTSTGFPDGTFDVYGNFTGSVAIDANRVDMTSGTMDVSQGDLLAIMVTAVARAGTDAMGLDGVQSIYQSRLQYAFPYGVVNTGTPAKNENALAALIVFDDGTVGWISGLAMHDEMNTSASTLSLNTGTTPDEAGALLQYPAKITINAIGFSMNAIATDDTFDLVAYSDPLGTPALLTGFPITIDPDFWTSTGQLSLYGIPETVLEADTDYVFAVKPTSANSIAIHHIGLPDEGSDGAVPAAFKKTLPWTVFRLVARTDGTGAFDDHGQEDYEFPLFAMQIVAIEDGEAAASGGGLPVVGGGIVQ